MSEAAARFSYSERQRDDQGGAGCDHLASLLKLVYEAV